MIIPCIKISWFDELWGSPGKSNTECQEPRISKLTFMWVLMSVVGGFALIFKLCYKALMSWWKSHFVMEGVAIAKLPEGPRPFR